MSISNTVRAPEFPTGLAWFNSDPLRLATLRGKIVLLEFWTFCCINCHHNIAQLHQLRARYGDELVVIGAHSAKFPAEHAAANVREAVLRHAIRYPVVSDTDFAIWNHYAVRAWPTLVVIDPDGRIASTQMGEFEAEQLAPRIDAMIGTWEQRGTLDRSPVVHTPVVHDEPRHILSYPSKLTLSRDGALYVADTGNNRVLHIQVDLAQEHGEIVHVWGAGDPALRDGAGEQAAFHHPRGLALHDVRLVLPVMTGDGPQSVDVQYQIPVLPS